MTNPEMKAAGFTIEEQVICRLSHIYSGEKIAIGATVLSDIATRLAKRLHSPELMLVGGGSWAAFDCDATPVGRVGDEWIAGPGAVRGGDWVEIFDLITAGFYRICIGPVQVDRSGACNISVLGPWAHPRLQLIGSRGIPDHMVRTDVLHFHIARHTPRALVAEVDFVCGVGYGARRQAGGLIGRPGLVVSDLGVFSFAEDGAGMRVESLHLGVSLERVQEATGFELLPSPDPIPITEPPTSAELACLREEVDPLGLRQLGSRDAPEDLAQSIAAGEKALWRVQPGAPAGAGGEGR